MEWTTLKMATFAPMPSASTATHVDALLGRIGVEPMQAGIEAEVLAPGEIAVEQRLMAEVADLPAQLPCVVGQLALQHPRRPAGRLPGSVWTEDEQGVTRGELQAHSRERGPLAEVAAQPAQLDRRPCRWLSGHFCTLG